MNLLRQSLTMDAQEALQAVERILQPNRLGILDQLVFCQSWEQLTYQEMAASTGYHKDYIKEIGSRLWQDLSDVTGQRITKKNLRLVLEPLLLGDTVKLRNSLTTSSNLDIPLIRLGEFPGCKENRLNGAFDVPGSPLPLNSPLYIPRPPIEELTQAEIRQPGSLIRIKATRRMGKSSLLNRIVAHAQAQNYKTVSLDFQVADEAALGSLNRFLRWFCLNVSHQLNLLTKLDDFWDEEMGSKVSCHLYFENYLLKQLDSPLVIILDEVNRVLEHPQIAIDFLSMLRFWHEQAKQDQHWQKLRIVMAHTTEVYVPLKINQSPFNVGLVVTLPPFTTEQVQDLAQHYGLPWQDTSGMQNVQSLITLVNGHPYLVSLTFYHLRHGNITLTQLLQFASDPSSIYSHHLREQLLLLQEEPELAAKLRQVMSSTDGAQVDAISAYKLENMGLIQLDHKQARPSCELYRSYFNEQLLTDSY